ncbi:MAG: hypothetical protein IPF59_08665 [Ignavibacteria bacterium]|nr:hypothetical protein [Ignavibacteria bacterium]MBK6420400.1 hypothetical protein [Ignavibacteria bacterium]
MPSVIARIAFAAISVFAIVEPSQAQTNETKAVYSEIVIQKPGGKGRIVLGFDSTNYPRIAVYDSKNTVRYELRFSDSVVLASQTLGAGGVGSVTQELRSDSMAVMRATSYDPLGRKSVSALGTSPGRCIQIRTVEDSEPYHHLEELTDGLYRSAVYHGEYGENRIYELIISPFHQQLTLGRSDSSANAEYDGSNLRIHNSSPQIVGTGLSISNSRGVEQISLTNNEMSQPEGPRFVMRDSSGTNAIVQQVYADGDPLLQLTKGSVTAQILASDGFAAFSIAKSDKTLLSLFYNNDRESSGLSLFTNREKPATQLLVQDDVPHFALYDGSSLRVSIGRQEILQSGRSFLSPPSSIYLFDESGTSVFKAP